MLSRYNWFLEDINETGICLIDNVSQSGQYKYLTEKSQIGLNLPNRDPLQLDRIKAYGATCVGAGHVCSAMDIVLGSFRYAMNDPQNAELAERMLRNLGPMVWHREIDGKKEFIEHGLIIRPKLDNIRTDYKTFEPEYDSLLEQLAVILEEKF